RSLLRRARSFRLRSCPVSGSRTVVPCKKPERADCCPGLRGKTWRKDVFVSVDPWHPLHVLSEKWKRASGLLTPAANQPLRLLKTDPPRNETPSNCAGTVCVSAMIADSFWLMKRARAALPLKLRSGVRLIGRGSRKPVVAEISN